MGSGLAINLIANGFSVFGLDLKPERQAAFTDIGGTLLEDTAELRRRVDAAFVMVINWDQAKSAILGPDGYVMVRDGYLGHIHIKDVLVDSPRATLTVKKMGEDQLAPLFAPLVKALRRDSYDVVISFESVYHPGNGNF
jgi:3-hydroxyisobutyrate dehydrogenase-like beta-hydroxyacid dehydrogenase